MHNKSHTDLSLVGSLIIFLEILKLIFPSDFLLIKSDAITIEYKHYLNVGSTRSWTTGVVDM